MRNRKRGRSLFWARRSAGLDFTQCRRCAWKFFWSDNLENIQFLLLTDHYWVSRLIPLVSCRMLYSTQTPSIFETKILLIQTGQKWAIRCGALYPQSRSRWRPFQGERCLGIFPGLLIHRHFLEFQDFSARFVSDDFQVCVHFTHFSFVQTFQSNFRLPIPAIRTSKMQDITLTCCKPQHLQTTI